MFCKGSRCVSLPIAETPDQGVVVIDVDLQFCQACFAFVGKGRFELDFTALD